MTAFPMIFPRPLDFAYCAIYEGDHILGEMNIPNPGSTYFFELTWSPSLKNKTVCILGYVSEQEDPVFQYQAKIQDLFPRESTLPTSCRLAHKLTLGM